MEQGVSGYFDIAGTEGLTGRFFYAEEYDVATGERTVSITGISVKSTSRGGTWYLGGQVKANGVTLCTMEYIDKVTHSVGLSASTEWNEVKAIDMWGLYFPWKSGAIGSNADGTAAVTFDVDITFWNSSSSGVPAIKGSYTTALTQISVGPRVYLHRDGENTPLDIYMIKSGTPVKVNLKEGS